MLTNILEFMGVIIGLILFFWLLPYIFLFILSIFLCDKIREKFSPEENDGE